MCPRGRNDSQVKCDCNNNQPNEKSNHRISPLLQVVTKSKGGQSLYACFCAYSLFFLFSKCLIIFFNHQERVNCIEFFGGQLYPFAYFVHLFIAHHLIMFSVVYPLAKYFRQNALILQLTAALCIVLCKLALYFLVYSKEDSSTTIRAACAGENVRIMMKCISFLHEVHKLPQPTSASNEISLRKLNYFLFAPTLLYRSSYEQTRRSINWRAFFSFISEFIVLTFMWAFFVKDVLRPSMLEHKRVLEEEPSELITSYIKVLLVNATHVLVFFFYIAFGFLHSYSNAMAEICCFADRGFYKEWWISHNAAEMLRKWNRIVGDWLHEYIYKWLLAVGLNRLIAMVTVLLLSGLYHDYLVANASRKCMPLFVPLMSLSVIPYVLSPYTSKILTFTQYNAGSTTFSLIFGGLVSYHATSIIV